MLRIKVPTTVVIVLSLIITTAVLYVSQPHLGSRLRHSSTIPDAAPRQPAILGTSHEQEVLSLEQAARDGSWRQGWTVKDFNDHFDKIVSACRNGQPGCKKNNAKVIILGWYHFTSMLRGHVSGESVWSDSVTNVLHALGYSMIIAENGNKEAVETVYRAYHDHVTLVFWVDDDWGGGSCERDSTCVYSDPELPVPPPNATHLNIPLWKVFNFLWWNGPGHPLGGPFTFSPENYASWTTWANGRDNYYLGYSLEATCLKTRYVPYSERPRQIYIFAKYLSFFVGADYILMNTSTDAVSDRLGTDFFTTFSTENDAEFLGSFENNVGVGAEPPKGIKEIPKLNRQEFEDVIARSRVVMGLAHPLLSPTPWEALCLGVPFINTVGSWDVHDPDNRSKWSAQQDAVLHLPMGEPYVYHVKMGDRAGLDRALKKALDTPIQRFIPQQMKIGTLISRVQRVVETDWRLKGLELIEKVDYKNIQTQ